MHKGTGDSGNTSFGRGMRVSKADACIELVGTLDEAQVALGFAATQAKSEAEKYTRVAKNISLSAADYEQPSPAILSFEKRACSLDEVYHCLIWMQRAVFTAGTVVMEVASKTTVETWTWDEQLAEIEKQCELFAAQSMPESFILPGGSELAVRIESARVVIRRLERAYCVTATVAASEKDHVELDALPFFNRLSTLCFILARYSNEVLEVSEISL